MKNKLFSISLIFISVLAVSSCRNMVGKKAYMRKTYRNIKKQVKDVTVIKLQDTVKVLFPSNLMFATNSDVLDSAVFPKIHRFANALNKFNKTSILINGHTDNVGDEEYNLQLSNKRSETAKIALGNNKVVAERMLTWGLGMKYPIATNETEEGKALNRRVEFIILYKEK